MAAPTVYPNSHVGFDSITSQIERKLLKRGFQFNVICVGTSLPSSYILSHLAIQKRDCADTWQAKLVSASRL